MDDNVTSLDAYKIAELIAANWLDAHSDSGAIYERSKKALEVLHNTVSEELWAEAVVIAHRRWGQQ
jgi:hypothetical protein